MNGACRCPSFVRLGKRWSVPERTLSLDHAPDGGLYRASEQASEGVIPRLAHRSTGFSHGGARR
jgi:hypothetical protein